MTKRGEARRRRISAALKRIGAARLEAFLRAARDDGGKPFAMELINRALDEGKTLEAILLDDRDDGYFLEVSALGPLRFDVEFGCVPSPMVGDGGTWTVEFDEQGRVVGVEGGVIWMS